MINDPHEQIINKLSNYNHIKDADLSACRILFQQYSVIIAS